MVVLSVGLSVSSLVTRAYFGKTAEAIEQPFVVVSRVGPRNCVLDGRIRRRNLANTVQRLCAVDEWVCHQDWRRGLFPTYFGKSCSGLLYTSSMQTVHIRYSIVLVVCTLPCMASQEESQSSREAYRL